MTIRKIDKGLIFCASLFILCSGCADINRTALNYALRQPWSTKPFLSAGMTKGEIKGKWGEPDIVWLIGYDELGLAKEEWVYYGRLSKALWLR